MRRMVAKTLALLALGACAGLVIGQQADDGKKPDPTAKDKKETPKEQTLEDLLAKALKDNPDLRVAESKVREAEAELNRARLQVTQKVIKAHQEVAANKILLESAKATVERAKRLFEQKAMSVEEFQISQQALQQAKVNLAKAEAELPYLLGKQTVSALAFSPDGHLLAGSSDGWIRIWDLNGKLRHAGGASQRVPTSMRDKIREAMATTVTADFDGVSAADALEFFWSKVKGVNLNIGDRLPQGKKGSVKFKEPVPLSAALQWFEDHFGVLLVVRDYGIVVVEPERRPPGAILLQDFLKSESAKTAPKK